MNLSEEVKELLEGISPTLKKQITKYNNLLIGHNWKLEQEKEKAGQVEHTFTHSKHEGNTIKVLHKLHPYDDSRYVTEFTHKDKNGLPEGSGATSGDLKRHLSHFHFGTVY
jgi:hypothetical protein